MTLIDTTREKFYIRDFSPSLRIEFNQILTSENRYQL